MMETRWLLRGHPIARNLSPCVGALVLACAETPPAQPVPPAECAGLWADSAAAAFVDELATVTASERPVWPGYDLGDGAYVLHAGRAASGEACLGVWRGGRALAYGALPEPPALSTPLYGYHLPPPDRAAGGNSGPRGAQPASIRQWLGQVGVERATLMPVTVEDFPIPLPALVKTQLAIHEGFHVEVQSPHWRGQPARWPTWDSQPDRAGIQACYAGSEAVTAALAEERKRLTRAVEALLDGDGRAACESGGGFLDGRRARYDLLRGVTVMRHDGTDGTCAEAEAILALEEGTADYASWTQLFDLGRATREQLLRRYRAQQGDVFYLTGAMQLHAVRLMDPDGMMGTLAYIAASESPDKGSITAAFEEILERYCGAR